MIAKEVRFTPPQEPQVCANGRKGGIPVWLASDLFRGGKELIIRHDGQDYRLRITQQNKLILTK